MGTTHFKFLLLLEFFQDDVLQEAAKKSHLSTYSYSFLMFLIKTKKCS